MSDKTKTLGQAIDDIVSALEALEQTSRLTAIRAACEQVGISQPLAGGTPAPAAVSTGSATLPPAQPAPALPIAMDIRALREQKQPTSAQEMACIVAYYLLTLAPANEHRASVSAADLEQYFRQAVYPLPKRIEQVLVDAKASGYFDSAGRGAYKLNPVGHNLVVHNLPRQGATVGAQAPRPRKAPKSGARRRTSK